MIAGAAVVMLAIAAPPAGANYGRVSAEIGCDRVVTWTASASSEGSAADRSNSKVLVEYRATSGQSPTGDWTAAGPEGKFDASNDFRFSGSFDLPSGADGVDLRVTPLAEWGDGSAPGGPRFARAEVPDDCADQPLVASVVADCASGGALVSVRNSGDAAQSVTVSAEGVVLRELALPADGGEELIVPLLEGRPSVIRVAAGGQALAESTVDADCDITGPAAVIIERCSTGQAVVFATTGDRPSGVMQVRVAGAAVNETQMQSGTAAQHSVDLSSGTVAMEVYVDDTLYSAGEIGTCAGPVAGAITCGVAGRAACTATEVEAPPPPPPPTSVDLGDTTLPRTGPWERAIALLVGGALLLAGGLAIATQDRRRPAPSPVADALAPYRQRWWDDR